MVCKDENHNNGTVCTTSEKNSQQFHHLYNIRSSAQFQGKRYKTHGYPEPVRELEKRFPVLWNFIQYLFLSKMLLKIIDKLIFYISKKSILVSMAKVNFNVLTKLCINPARIDISNHLLINYNWWGSPNYTSICNSCARCWRCGCNKCGRRPLGMITRKGRKAACIARKHSTRQWKYTFPRWPRFCSPFCQ